MLNQDYQVMPVGNLKKYSKNSRTHSDKQISQIADSIREFGFTNPILVDENNEIIAGHGRLDAALSLDMESVPVVVVKGLDADQKKALVIADNQLALNAGWDLELLTSEIEQLMDHNYDIDLLGFDEDFIKTIFGDDSELEDDNYTRKIETPLYEPTGDMPTTDELVDRSKTIELIEKIKEHQLPEDIENFLIAAAHRHDKFNFKEIAEYYAHCDADIQALFEESALVIIDFNQAIEKGFVKLSEEALANYE